MPNRARLLHNEGFVRAINFSARSCLASLFVHCRERLGESRGEWVFTGVHGCSGALSGRPFQGSPLKNGCVLSIFCYKSPLRLFFVGPPNGRPGSTRSHPRPPANAGASRLTYQARATAELTRRGLNNPWRPTLLGRLCASLKMVLRPWVNARVLPSFSNKRYPLPRMQIPTHPSLLIPLRLRSSRTFALCPDCSHTVL
jgi:hypothetical protein